MPTYTSLWNLYVCVDIKCILVHSLKIFFNEVFASLFQNVCHFPRGGFPPPHALQSYILSQGITSCCQRSATSRPPPPPVGQRAASLPRPEKAVQ